MMICASLPRPGASKHTACRRLLRQRTTRNSLSEGLCAPFAKQIGMEEL